MNYEESTLYLLQRLPMFQRVGAAAFKPGLERISLICRELDNPQDKFKSIHVAGTNGKGSSSHLLAAILQEAGYQVGLTTSPHLKNFTERIRLNGQEIPQNDFTYFVNTYKNLFEQVEASFFEVMIAMAFWYFAKEKVDFAVIETGLGGRLDATNIITPILSLITNIGYDHQSFLGNTLAEIAGEKAGIIKKNIPIVISEKHPETQALFEQYAQIQKAPIYFAEDFYEISNWKSNAYFLSMNVLDKKKQQNIHLQSVLKGSYQLKNALGVLKSTDLLQTMGYDITQKSINEGFKEVIKLTHLKGRWQILQTEPLLIADTAHNLNGIMLVLEQIQQTPHEQLHFILGFMKDKDVEKILALYPKNAFFYFCQPDVPRAMPLPELTAIARKLALNYTALADTNQAIGKALQNAQKNDLVLVGGSTFVVAEIKNL
ncbi:MAG: folylpolyglutamate synthase/dihydrofolate synthase family protein [Thermonemataceae bacterium]|nr:folylpolyglutamate synthase/dihydrofolate synthase family protein [Thermonemataceae bacterium]